MVAVGAYGVPLRRSDRLRLELHDDHCDVSGYADWLARQGAQPLAADLFTGAGGLSLGIQEAGWKVALGVDFDERAVETHAANFPGLSLLRDLSTPEARDEVVALLQTAEVDLIAGGPPCQPFSRAGRNKIRDLVVNHGRDPEDHRRELWRAYLDVVTRVRPRAVLMENVPDMGLSDDFAVVRIIQDKLENLGYATQVRLASAADYGVPQHRKRLIMLARNDIGHFSWPKVSSPRPRLWDAIGDLPEFKVVPKEQLGARELPYEESGKTAGFSQKMRKGAAEGIIFDHMTRAVREDDYEAFRSMNSGTLYSEIDPKYIRYRTDSFTDKYKRLAANDLSRTITAHIAKDGYWYIHPTQPRTLTVREAARVQTFPDRFRFAGTRSDAFRQIGNAVPPMLGTAAARALEPVATDQAHESRAAISKWKDARDSLAQWAQRQRDSGSWYWYPGKSMGLATAAIAAILTTASAKNMATVLEEAKGWDSIEAEQYERLIEVAPTPGIKRKLERLAPRPALIEAWVSFDEDAVRTELAFKPAEESAFTMLRAREDLLFLSQATLRVASRVSGTDSAQVNRQTAGRVDLSRLVGAGDDSALRLASVQAIGKTLCHLSQPNCGECPLMRVCHYAQERQD